MISRIYLYSAPPCEIMTKEWQSVHPKNGLLSDLALLALVLPGTFLAHFVLFVDDAPWPAHLLILSVDLFAIVLITLLALFLNRWLCYRFSDEEVAVFGIFGWFEVLQEEVAAVRLVAFTANVWSYKVGMNALSGMVYGVFKTEPLGRVHLYGYAHAKRGVVLERRGGKPILLTPQEPEDFSAHLYALGYPSGDSQATF